MIFKALDNLMRVTNKLTANVNGNKRLAFWIDALHDEIQTVRWQVWGLETVVVVVVVGKVVGLW